MAWSLTPIWNTGDINSRTTNCTAVIDDAGTPKIIAPVQHGVKCFDRDGSLLWTYNSITNGYDVQHIATGNLNNTGYNDCSVVCSGYYTTSTDGKVAILDKAGNSLQLLLTSSFSGTAPSKARWAICDGTDIYISTNQALHKFTKSGSTWSESWYKAIGECSQIQIRDCGNGKRIYVAMSGTGAAIYCYQTDGTEDWHVHSNNGYARIVEFGKVDSTVTGTQILYPYQSGFQIIDKDGNVLDSADIVPGNVCISVTAFDNNGDGEDEIYISDMNDDVECYERTGVNTYTEQYRKTDFFPSGKYGALTHYDLNGDGEQEIIAVSSDGHLRVYDKTLANSLLDITIGHGICGGWIPSYQQHTNGIYFVDTSNDGDGLTDVVISGSTGYVDVLEADGINSPSVSPSGAVTSESPSVSPSQSPSISPSVSPSPSPGWEGYTRGDYVSLPTTGASLETAYSAQDYLDVDTKNNVRVAQTGTNQFMIHEFKDYVGANTACTVECELQTTQNPATSTVYLQIYNLNTTTWDTIDSDNSSAIDTDFILTASVADLTNYKDGEVITCRVYQDAT